MAILWSTCLLVRELHLAVEVLKACGLEEEDKLVMDEATLGIVELVYILHNFLTFILYKCDENLGLIIGVQVSVLLENQLDVRQHLERRIRVQAKARQVGVVVQLVARAHACWPTHNESLCVLLASLCALW